VTAGLLEHRSLLRARYPAAMIRLSGAVPLAIVVLVVAGCGGGHRAEPPGTTSATAPPASRPVRRTPAHSTVARPFAPTAVWNLRLPDDAALDPRSHELVRAFVADIARQRKAAIGPWIQTTNSSSPVYTVPRGQRRVPVVLDVREAYGRTLRRAFRSVPLPSTARPAQGPDRHLTLLQPATDSMWEFWHLRRENGRWRAAWGGAMRNVSTNPGYFTRGSWPGGEPNWGATATSLPLIAGLIRISELERGRIDHALAIAIPNARAKAAAWPAQRTDGTLSAPVALPEGARLRLDPKLDIAALDLPPAVRAIAVAAQRYGLIVRDKTLHATGFFAEDPTPSGRNPYPRLFGGRTPGELLARFPWEHLQLVKMRLRAS
jgi:hypothetical protein